MYEGSATSTTLVEEVRTFGRGEMRLTEYRLSPVAEGEGALFVEVAFYLCVTRRSALR